MASPSDDGGGDGDYVERTTSQRSSLRTKRRKGRIGQAIIKKSTPSPVSPLLQPLMDLLTARHAPEDSEDTDFGDLVGPVLLEYEQVREELEKVYEKDEYGRPIQLLSLSDAEALIRQLDAKESGGAPLTIAEALVLRKLKLQRMRHLHKLSCPALRPDSPTTLTLLPPTRQAPKHIPQVLDALYAIKSTPYERTFLSRLNGMGNLDQTVVAVDWDVRAPWMELMEDIKMHYMLKYPEADAPEGDPAPISYVTLAAAHLPQVHDILHRSFWAGIDVSDSLQFGPQQATIIAMYRHLVVGCAFLSSPQETYITYLAVRAGWDNAQIATSMLYHLITRNPNKDITLHVSANNPAMLLYNRFGFKAEEFVVGFYEDYLDPQSRASKNAFRLRLRL